MILRFSRASDLLNTRVELVKLQQSEAEIQIFIFGTCVLYLMAIYKYLHTAKVNELLRELLLFLALTGTR